ASLAFVLFELLPRSREQFVAPARKEQLVGLGDGVGRFGTRLGIECEFASTAGASGPSAVVDHQSIDDRFDERAEPATARVGVAEIPADKPQREILEYVVGRLSIAKARRQVALDRPAVPLEQQFLRLGGSGI